MEFDNTFTVAAPIDEVWGAVLDVERVAPCVPGAQVLEQTGDNAYKVAIKVKLGPVSMVYNGDVEVVEQDPEARCAVMSAKARESRGQGTADARVEMRLSHDDGATHGAIHTDVAISGRAAAMGQGIIADVSARLIDTFAANLAQMLTAQEQPAPGAPEAAGSGAAGRAEAATTEFPAGGGAGAEGAPALGTARPEPPTPPPAPSAAARPAPPPAPPAEPEGLPILSIAGGVIAERLRNPKVLAGLVGAAVVVFALRRRGR
jgi:carbon monoxide dehydrogenase subunit G